MPSECENIQVRVPRIAESPKKNDDQPSPDRTSKLVPPATRAIDFAKDIQPILTRSCVGCHGEKNPQSNFSLTSRAGLIRGGDSDLPAIVPGKSADSPLVRFAAGVEKKLEMPPLKSRDKYPPLSDKEIALLRAWIDQGAKWSTTIQSTKQ